MNIIRWLRGMDPDKKAKILTTSRGSYSEWVSDGKKVMIQDLTKKDAKIFSRRLRRVE